MPTARMSTTRLNAGPLALAKSTSPEKEPQAALNPTAVPTVDVIAIVVKEDATGTPDRLPDVPEINEKMKENVVFRLMEPVGAVDTPMSDTEPLPVIGTALAAPVAHTDTTTANAIFLSNMKNPNDWFFTAHVAPR